MAIDERPATETTKLPATKLGEITITYNGPGDISLDPPVGQLNRDFQTMTWNLVDRSGLHAKFAVPGGITFPFPPPLPPPAYSRWDPPGTTPTGDDTRYQAQANDKIPHGNPRKIYSYDIEIVRDPELNPEPNAKPISEKFHVPDVLAKMKQKQHGQTAGEVHPIKDLEIFDPPVENQPQP
jgi:hypothetical protein